jgi:D-alanine-D-alanine ligase
MHIVLFFNRVALTDSASDLDVLRQCVAVESSLHALGHTTSRAVCSLDLAESRHAILTQQPDAVFNLVESLGGTDRLMPVAAVLLEAMGIPFTGASSLAMLSTSGKLVAKQRLLDYELPTPAWMPLHESSWQGLSSAANLPEQAIIKAVAEHASLGINDDSVIFCKTMSADEIALRIANQSQSLGTPHFAEQFIDGREFNLSVLAGDDGPEVLPPAEIMFVNFSDSKPKIVGHDAKWSESSSEYHNTPRRFDFPQSDQALLDELEALARRCWSTFGLRGYARVDFRVDADGQPWILEINANPCLTPDAGFAAAVQEAGLSFDEVIQRILADAFRTSAL